MKTSIKTAIVALGVISLAGLPSLSLAQTPSGSGTGKTVKKKTSGPSGPVRVLLKMDLDKDGVVTSEEVASVRAAAFAKIDANHDGKADKSELDIAMLKRLERRKIQMRNRLLKTLDMDRDGALSKGEYQDQRLKPFVRADTNSDGEVSSQEMKALDEAFRSARRTGKFKAFKKSVGEAMNK